MDTASAGDCQPDTPTTNPDDSTSVATIIGEGDKDLVRITVGFQGPAPHYIDNEVVATDGHPFWVTSTDQWTDAVDLQVGQWLQTSTGAEVPITAIDQYTQHTQVYNLTITDIHTYYVLAGNTPVLVHNQGSDERISGTIARGSHGMVLQIYANEVISCAQQSGG